jgi:predicted DNA binding CopG/RHH family protein
MNKEEQEIIDAYEKGKATLRSPSKGLIKQLAEAGENTFRKDKRINIRLSGHDLAGIQKKALKKGIPYQSLISGLIHQYVEGDLVEK